MKRLDIRPKLSRINGTWRVSYVFESTSNYNWIRAAKRWALMMNA